MNRYNRILIPFLALILVLSVAPAQAAMTPVAARVEGAGSSFDFVMVSGASYETDQMPVVRAAEPALGRPHRKETGEFVRRDQFAVLPDPVDGRELVDRMMTSQAEEPVNASVNAVRAPRRVYERERIGPGYAIPVCHGA
jgi:hypothetical protein